MAKYYPETMKVTKRVTGSGDDEEIHYSFSVDGDEKTGNLKDMSVSFLYDTVAHYQSELMTYAELLDKAILLTGSAKVPDPEPEVEPEPEPEPETESEKQVQIATKAEALHNLLKKYKKLNP